ncbi:MAG: hypothetical protein ACI8QS_001700 [Planctomycetota bacterium]|jgi:hypothetical protein
MNDVRLSALADRLLSLDSPDAETLQLVRSEIVELKHLLERLLQRELADFLGAADTMIRSIGVLEGESYEQVRELVLTLLSVVAEAVNGLGSQHSADSGLELLEDHANAPAEARSEESLIGARPPLTLEGEGLSLTYQGARTMSELLLGQILIESGNLSRAQLVEALKHQTKEKVRIGEALVALGFVTKEQVDQAIQEQDALAEHLHMENQGSNVALLHDLTIGEILTSVGGVAQEDIERALRVHRASGKRLGESLVELGVVSWERVEEAVRIQAKNRLNSVWGAPDAKGLSLRLDD